MEPRPSHPRTRETPFDPAEPGSSDPAGAGPEATVPFRPDYGPVARVPPTGDPINLRPAPPEEAPIPPPRRQVTGPLLAGLAALIVIVLLLAATIATVAWLGSDDDGGDDSGAVGARPESTREAELEATIAGLEARIAADASPSPATTPSEPPPAPTELPPTPTAPAAATEAEGGSGIATATAAPAQAQADGAEISAASLLPSDEDVPAGFVLADDAALASIEEVAGAFSDPDDAATRLENWGWEENASRTYQLAEDAAAPESGMTFLYVSIHRFGSDQAAQEALTYFADELVAFRDLTEAEVSDIGDTARGLVGPIEGGGEEGALYVQEGPYLLRIGSVAPEGAALSAAVDAGRAILERAGL